MPEQAESSSDTALERALEEVFSSLNVYYDKTATDGDSQEGTVCYRIGVRPELDLRLSFEIHGDQFEVWFNGCRIRIEEAAYMARFIQKSTSRKDWRGECIRLVNYILTSDLRIETRWCRGRTLGGYLDRWNGSGWDRLGGGGSLLLVFGRGRIEEYRSWLTHA
jgi:hypothetical protein